METLMQDLRYSIRALAKKPGFAAVAVMTLALGIGANTAIFSVVNAVLFRPLPFPDSDRLVMVWTRVPEKGVNRFSVSPHNFQDWRSQGRSFEEIALFESRRGTITGGEMPELIQHSLVSPGFFRVMGVAPLMGRAFREEENLSGNDTTVILSYGFWQRFLGGSPDVLGRTITLDEKLLTIVGVMPSDFSYPNSETQLWKTFGTAPDYSGSRASYTARSVARLKTGVTIEQAQTELDAIMANLANQYPKSNTGIEAMAEPLHEVAVGSSRAALLLLWGIVGLVLLIACANVANLLLARGAAREKEMAIRAALGAGRGRIIRQLLTESMLMSVAGGIAGVLLAAWGVELLLSLSADSIPRIDEVEIDKGVLLFALGISLLTGIISGLLPALHSARSDLNETLKEGGRQSGAAGRQGLRSSLIVVEVALALLVLVGAGLVVRSFIKVMQQNPGFVTENLLTVRVEPQVRTEFQSQPVEIFRQQRAAERERIAQFYDQLLKRIGALPGVKSAAAVSHKPLSGTFWKAQLIFQDRPLPPENEMPIAQVRVVTPGYFQTTGIPLLSGRAPMEGDINGATRVAVINEKMARLHWPGENPVDRRITTSNDPDDWLTVIGVVGDVRQDMETDPDPLIYVPLAQARSGFYKNWGMDLMVRTEGNPLMIAGAVRKQVNNLDSNLPVFRINSMEQVMADSVAERRFSVMLLGVFAAVALLLVGIGIYGVISYMVSQRTHEIGIRMALGAKNRDVIRMVIAQGAKLTLIGGAIGNVSAYFLTRYMESLMYEVSATDPATFALIPSLLFIVALLACYIPARRAARVDPMEALRYE